MVNAIVLFLVLGCSVTAGYYAGSPSSSAIDQDVRDKLAHGDDGSPAKSLSFAMTVISQEHARAAGRKVDGNLAVETALDKVKLSDQERSLFRALGDDPVGMRLRRALIAGRHGAEVPGTDLYTQNFLKDLFANPRAGAAVLRQGLDRVPASDFPLEHAALLVSLASVPDQGDTVKQLALDELTKNVIPARPDPSLAQTQEELNVALSTTPSMLLPVTAESIILKNISDPNEALQDTVAGIVAQQDLGIRSTLAAQFNQAFPAMSGQLSAALSNQGVTLASGTEPSAPSRFTPSAELVAQMQKNGITPQGAPPTTGTTGNTSGEPTQNSAAPAASQNGTTQ